MIELKKIYYRIGRLRVFVGYVFGILFFLFSKPNFSLLPFVIGPILIGIFLRAWAAGSILKKKEIAKYGPYSLIRHPLYLGSFLIGMGFTLLGGAGWFMGFLLGFFIFYMPKIMMEEETLRDIYGEEYERYRREVPVFFPKGIRFKKGTFSWEKLKRNKEYNLWLGVFIFFILYYLKGLFL